MPDSSKHNNHSSLSVNKGVESSHSVNPPGPLPGLQKTGAGGRNRPRKKDLSPDDYIAGIREGDRAVLSRAITLVESTKAEHRELARKVIEGCLPQTGNSIRLGITGVPGVGKSTFIEALGNHVIRQGHALAVLAVDPSSSRSKGSILGDKTRMETLANNPAAFIRPSPASGSAGGVARKTREAIYLCEAAGFDTIFIETVGVGQAETAVHSMTDFFLLLMLAGAGDELQGIKRGIMEMADAIAINKTDSSSQKEVRQAVRAYKNALHLFPPPESGWPPKVTTCSALEQDGIEEIWSLIQDYIQTTDKNGFREKKRNRQARHWMYETIHTQLRENFYDHPSVKTRLKEFEQKVRDGELSPFNAAQKLLELYQSANQ